jgi:hypothetical protein
VVALALVVNQGEGDLLDRDNWRRIRDGDILTLDVEFNDRGAKATSGTVSLESPAGR